MSHQVYHALVGEPNSKSATIFAEATSLYISGLREMRKMQDVKELQKKFPHFYWTLLDDFEKGDRDLELRKVAEKQVDLETGDRSSKLVEKIKSMARRLKR
jgi:hypothetical protein